MGTIVDLQDRPVYGLSQVDRILGLKTGTARRWIDGYRRGTKSYPPVVRSEPTGDEIVTWGEFVEARLLSEYREAGVPLFKMRPVVELLRAELDTKYPLASARTWLDVDGREIVRRAQEQTELDKRLALVEVVRTDQTMLEWTAPAQEFADSAIWSDQSRDAVLISLRPLPEIPQVLVDPRRSFGEPSVRGVRTDIIGELIRAGDPPEMIADMYELEPELVNAAVRYELLRVPQAS